MTEMALVVMPCCCSGEASSRNVARLPRVSVTSTIFPSILFSPNFTCVCVCARARACGRLCVRACVRACVQRGREREREREK